MLHWKIEGQEIRQGLSIYRPSDKNSAGGCLRIKNHLWIARFSKWTKKFHFRHYKSNPISMEERENTHSNL